MELLNLISGIGWSGVGFLTGYMVGRDARKTYNPDRRARHRNQKDSR